MTRALSSEATAIVIGGGIIGLAGGTTCFFAALVRWGLNNRNKDLHRNNEIETANGREFSMSSKNRHGNPRGR